MCSSMEEDKFALVEKIIKDIDNVMSKNAELCDFDIVPVDSNFHNKSPVLHVENCLGLESWCVKHVYMYCYTELMDNYFCKIKRRNSTLDFYPEKLSQLLSVTLLLNPELTTLWNKRRDMVLKNVLDKCSELKLTRLVLSRKPKCNEAFGYRRWILDSLFKDENLQSNYLQTLVNEEIQLCKITSEKSSTNYHSWNHRMWLIKTLKTIPSRLFNLDLLYVREYNSSEQCISNYVSDFSCFHYRQFCIKNVLQNINDVFWKTFQKNFGFNLRQNFELFLLTHGVEVTYNFNKSRDDQLVNQLFSHISKSCNCKTDNVNLCRKLELLFRELDLNKDLIVFFKSHETLWYYRRYVVHEIIDSMYDYYGLIKQHGALVNKLCKKCNPDDLRQKQVKIVKYDSSLIYSSVLFKVLMMNEMQLITEQCNDKFALRYEKYLKFMEYLSNLSI